MATSAAQQLSMSATGDRPAARSSVRPSGVAKAPGELPDPLRLMVIDREPELVEALLVRGERRGWDVHVLPGSTTRRQLARLRPHALVVDPRLLGSDPVDWLQRAAAALPRLALVVCASSSTVAERVRALQLGVDDWLAKPAHPDEVIARVESAVRRRMPRGLATDSPQTLATGELQIDFEQRQVFVGDLSAQLTRREFGVLQAVVEQHGVVARRESIYLQVWGVAMIDGDRSVDVHVRKLRRKLADVSPGWGYIHTQFRVGYRFQPERLGELDGSTEQ